MEGGRAPPGFQAAHGVTRRAPSPACCSRTALLLPTILHQVPPAGLQPAAVSESLEVSPHPAGHPLVAQREASSPWVEGAGNPVFFHPRRMGQVCFQALFQQRLGLAKHPK